MDNLTQILTETLVNANKNGSKINLDGVIKEVIRTEVEKTVNEILGHELTAFLGYEKSEQGASKECGNSRNGFYTRGLNTTYGPISLNVPRDRNGQFESGMFEKNKRSTKDIGQMILKLYSSGMTDVQIQEIVDSLYSHKYSTSTISVITDAVKEDVENFKTRRIREKYFALFADAIYIPLRRDTVEKEAVFIVLGIDFEGKPEVLAFDIQPSETKESWLNIFRSLTNRGLKSSRVLVSDGFTGLDEIVKDLLPGCLYQRCFIHLCRNLMDKVRMQDRDEISFDFMELSRLDNGKNAINAYHEFLEKRGKKYSSISNWGAKININHIFNFYHFPKELRKVIYSNNRIESFNKEIRRNAKAHVQFCTEDAEAKFLVTLFNRYNFNTRRNGIRNKNMLDADLLEF